MVKEQRVIWEEGLEIRAKLARTSHGGVHWECIGIFPDRLDHFSTENVIVPVLYILREEKVLTVDMHILQWSPSSIDADLLRKAYEHQDGLLVIKIIERLLFYELSPEICDSHTPVCLLNEADEGLYLRFDLGHETLVEVLNKLILLCFGAFMRILHFVKLDVCFKLLRDIFLFYFRQWSCIIGHNNSLHRCHQISPRGINERLDNLHTCQFLIIHQCEELQGLISLAPLFLFVEEPHIRYHGELGINILELSCVNESQCQIMDLLYVLRGDLGLQQSLNPPVKIGLTFIEVDDILKLLYPELANQRIVVQADVDGLVA